MFKECKKNCQKLIVGVMTDECVESYKGKKPLMDFIERLQLVLSCKEVYKVYVQDTFEYPHYVLRLKDVYADDFIIFDNEEHDREGADILIPYTKWISSTKIKAEYL